MSSRKLLLHSKANFRASKCRNGSRSGGRLEPYNILPTRVLSRLTSFPRVSELGSADMFRVRKILLGIISRALMYERRRRIDTSWRPHRRKGQTNSRALSEHAFSALFYIHPSFSFSRVPSCPVLSNTLRHCVRAPTRTSSP